MGNTSRTLGALAALGSLGLLAAALAFQSMGYAPCAMCVWQRWPHAVAAVAGGLLFTPLAGSSVLVLGALSAASTAAIGIYHTGVERRWWEGPSSCTGGADALDGLSGQALLSFDDVAPIVMCDEVVWQFLGLSMASWNALLSLGLFVLWICALGAIRRDGEI